MACGGGKPHFHASFLHPSHRQEDRMPAVEKKKKSPSPSPLVSPNRPAANPMDQADGSGPRPPAEESIRMRAYELFEARGREPGRELEDWSRAEQEIRDSQDH